MEAALVFENKDASWNYDLKYKMDSQMRTKRLLSDLGTSPPKRSRWFTIDVAKSEDKDEEKEEKPILLLKPFSPIPHVCFDKVKLGSSKTCVLYLKNPIVAEQTIIIDKFPFDCGFFVEEIKIHVDAGEEKALNITWTPEKACNCRETIKFKSSTGCKTQAYLLGTAYSPMKKKTKCLQPKVMKESNKANSCNASVVKSQQCFKSVLTANKENVEVYSVLSHRNPYASSNLYYDKRWMEKQEVAFTSWLNYILTPADSFNSSDDEVDSAKIWIESIKDTAPVRAPTKEELSLKTYTAVKNLNQLRKTSCMLYQSDEIAAVVKTVEKEVDMKRLSVRKDRALHADLGIKRDILDMLLSYNSLWLRIGLETIYGEIIVLKSNCDVVGLSRFIIRRLLSDPEITAKFSHTAVINYFKPGYEEEIKRFTLKKFLLLVYFLDIAKRSHLIKNDPCLFTKKAKYKCSRDLLHAFSRDYLSGEGDITKHLRYLGYKVSHEQTRLEEFDFSVKNIAVDLRCGLRLGRVVELIFQDWSISKMLRINTHSRLNKVHNNDVILKALQKASIEIQNDINPKDLVDGHREKTLDLLWQIVFKTQISKLLNKELLRQENAFLCRNLKLKSEYAAFKALRNPNTEFECSQPGFLDSKLYKEHEVLQLLLQWCQNVCAYYGLKVHNFTSSFSDGRALCFLLHHYHPNLLPYKNIKTETSYTFHEQQMIAAEADDNSPFHGNKEFAISMKELLKNEVHNLGLAFQKFQEIGQIPILSSPSDMSNTLPDEKVMITLVSYVNLRLMELSVEIRAARKILHAWRRWHFRKDQDKLKIEISAVVVIQNAWRKFVMLKNMKRHSQAAVVIQSNWRRYSAMKQLKALKQQRHFELLNQKATIIQACFKGYISRKNFLKCHSSAIVIQSYARMWLLKSHFQKLKKVTLRIQQKYRAKVIGHNQRLQYIFLKEVIIKLQSYSKGFLLREMLGRQRQAAIIIQSNIRMYLAVKKFKSIKNACLFIQQKFRAAVLAKNLRKQYLRQKAAAIQLQKWYRSVKLTKIRIKSAVRIQSLYRGYKSRQAWHKMLKRYISCKKYRKKKEACIIIQQRLRANIKMRITRQNYLRMKKGFVLLQALVRGTIARKHQLLLNEKATLIQSCVRSWLAQKKYRTLKRTCLWLQQKYRAKREMRKMREQFLNLRNAAITVQTHYRCYKKMCSDRNKYLAMKSGFLSLQALYRGRKVRRHHALLNKKAVIIQTCFRRYISCKKYRKKKEACIIIQQRLRANIKMRITRQNYLRMKKGFILLQALVRGTIARKHQLLLNEKATLIQSCVRSWLAQKKYRTLKRTCLWLQQKYRAKREMRKMREQFLNLRNAAITVQTHYRCYKKMCSDRNKYLAMKSGFLSLQALYRGRKVRRHHALLNKKAVIIQTCFRRYISCKKYRKKKEACIIIQQRLRANIKMRITRQNYLRMKKGFVLLQALVRGTIARKHQLLLNEKATLIQSCVRSWLAQKKYRTLRRTCLWLQQKYRAKREMRKMLEQFLNLRKAAITVQTHYRCYKKMCSDSKKYLAMKSGFLSFQALYRGRKVRRHRALLNKKAVIIQTCFRRYISCKKYRKKKEACIIIQQRLRANIKMRITRQNYLRMKKGFVLLQALVRGTIARKHLSLLNEKAILIQSRVRSWLAQKKYRTLKRTCLWLQQKYRAKREMRKMREQFLNLRNAAITVQTHYRCYKKMCSDRNKYLAMKSGFLSLQALYRGRKVRRHHALLNKKAVIIQTCFRRYITCMKYRKKKEACIIIQQRLRANIKMRITRQNYLRIKKGFVLLQQKYRAKREMRKMLEQFLNLRKAAITVQTHYRCYKKMCSDRNKYLAMKSGFLSFQALYRGRKYRAKREMRKMHEKFLRLKKAAITIQAAVRCHLARKEYVAIRDASIKVQSVLRMYIAKKNYKQQQKSAIFIQSFYRMHLARTKFIALKHSCIIIQSLCRRHIAQKRFFEVRNSAIVIQKYFFATKKAKEQRYHYLHKKHSAIIIQAYFRAYHSRSKFLKMKHSVIKIEQYYIAYKKMVEKKQNYLKMVKGFTQLQALVRGIKARKYISTLHQNAIVIQSHYRGWLARKYYQRLKAAIVIQRNFRLWKEKRFSYVSTRMDLWKAHQLHNWYLQLKRNVVKFQQCARLYLQKRTMAATVIQSYVRMWFVQREFKKHQAAKKIQAAWRGFRLRNSITNQEIIEARRKIKAADSSDSNKLKNRMIESLRLLFDQKLNYMIVALGHLDVCTQLSSDCCESLVSSGGLDVLLGLLQCCNRSVPHMEIIKLATNVLLNVAKYNKTVNHLWRAMPCLEVYLHLMKAFRETASEIFTKCCTLVWIFCQDPEKAKVIKQNTAATEQLISLHFLVSRKQMINEKRLLQKAASSARNSTFMSSRLCINKSRSIAPRESVEIEPDWMLGKQRRREFTDPLVAISSVLISLGLEAKKVMPKKT
ncbi:abnormal spindle-like microcephaly-associated protein homolog [Uloborus diversus]|uniref:abnormal spindle-like microcephaly-associated protein homolog n=1 Tax=Uloborus diversus TaxID=327109 RepID=UPI00240A1E8D|nr:abnormal spindle-like microcephaly-associated protein homolog [Uloborus diversus]